MINFVPNWNGITLCTPLGLAAHVLCWQKLNNSIFQ